VIPWSPLARGRLTRPWEQKGSTERGGKDEFAKKLYGATEESDKLVVGRVSEVARKRGVPQAQIALAWMLHKPYITSPIIGATKVQHLDDGVAALSVKLSPEEIASLEEPYVPHPVVGFS
jgi:aryl-alcohol dehydrogenase-like predicted oxidoreductase